LTNNAVAQKENYRETVHQNIPNLVILDKIPCVAVDDQTKEELMRSEYKPENNGALRRNIITTVSIVSSVLSGWNREHDEFRPTSATPPVTHISITRRPMTSSGAKSKYDVSVGEPVCGNIITKARKPRKLKTAWGDSCSSSSMSSSDSSTTGTPVNKSSLSSKSAETETCEDLLESARLWREKSKQTRERFNK
jgi:hypothetical protein